MSKTRLISAGAFSLVFLMASNFFRDQAEDFSGAASLSPVYALYTSSEADVGKVCDKAKLNGGVCTIVDSKEGKMEVLSYSF